MKVKNDKDIICWVSGGVTSAVACKLAIDTYGLDRCHFVFIDTRNESDDTYRFLGDLEKWYGCAINSIANAEYKSIQEVWYKFKSLNVASGAICSSELKRKMRWEYQRTFAFTHQVFGFDIREPRRAEAMKLNYPESKPVFPLLAQGYTKNDCIRVLKEAGIKIPASYINGYQNNNCYKTMCVQGGIGYWQKAQIDFPEKFDAMAKVEHELTDLKGKPVTALKDQSNKAKKKVRETGDKKYERIFLKPHPDYPEVSDLSMKKGRKPEPLPECNGMCGLNDGQ